MNLIITYFFRPFLFIKLKAKHKAMLNLSVMKYLLKMIYDL